MSILIFTSKIVYLYFSVKKQDSMAEEVNTGGLKRFMRNKEKINLEPELEKAVNDAYELASIRKKKEFKNKIIRTVIILLIIMLLIIGIKFIFFP